MLSGYISEVPLLMSFTRFNALQIFKLTIQPASVEVERAFSAYGLFATTPQSMRCASDEMRWNVGAI